MKKDKMMIVMRTDLGMGAGKMIAQACHAVVGVMGNIHPGQDEDQFDIAITEWLVTGMKKVCVAAESEEQLLQAVAKANELGIPVYLVRDSGLTQVNSGTATCCAVGPGKHKLIERVTGSLKLLP